jgi:DNA-binding response OmpR family regulator
MGSGMHYLIVEDEVEMAALIQHALENESTKISIAYDGEMAIRKLQSEEFDLAIMDIMIPKINVIGELRVEVSSQRVYLGSKQLTLSPKEFLLLLFLVRNMDISFSRQQILEEVWGTTDFIDPNVVDQYVSYLRKKIDSKNKSPMIETIRGVGYRFNRRVT